MTNGAMKIKEERQRTENEAHEATQRAQEAEHRNREEARQLAEQIKHEKQGRDEQEQQLLEHRRQLEIKVADEAAKDELLAVHTTCCAACTV